MSSEPANRRPRWVVLLLVLGPLWLIASAGVAVWLSLRDDKVKQQEAEQRFSQDMSETRIADDLRKFTDIIGERNLRNDDTRRNLVRAASMIDGLLGPQNTGYTMRRIPSDCGLPILIATLPGKQNDTPAIWLATHYDSPAESVGGEINASGCAALIAAAQAMAGDPVSTTVHFIFLPDGNETQAAIRPLLTSMPRPGWVATVDALGTQGKLQFLGDAEQVNALKQVGTLGLRGDANTHGSSLHRAFVALGLPAIRITSSLDPDPQAMPDSRQVAVHAGKLVEWLRRCSQIQPNR